MSKLQWAAVGAVLVLGIVAQIPRHDHEHMPGHDHSPGEASDHSDATSGDMPAGAMEAMNAVPTGRVRVLLNISGMT